MSAPSSQQLAYLKSLANGGPCPLRPTEVLEVQRTAVQQGLISFVGMSKSPKLTADGQRALLVGVTW